MNENSRNSFEVAHYLSKYLSMTETWIHNLLLNHQKFKPVVLTRKKANLIHFPVSPLYSLDDFSKVGQYVEILFFILFGYFRFFEKACRKSRIQILHVHFGYNGVKMIGLKEKLNIPMICSFYGDDTYAYPKNRNVANKYKYLFKKVDRILVLGPYMKKELMHLGCPETKILIHHLGIDIDRISFVKRSITEKRKIKFLIASGFVRKKGIDLTIQALSRLKDQHDFTLDIIGDGPLKNQIINEVEISGIKERIKLHGFKPYDYFLNLAYESDVFIQASRTSEGNHKEGTPMAIVDAMATGMAVISTKHSDIPEIVIDEENGYLAEENDLESLISCIQKIFNDPDKIEIFSYKGRAWVEKEFNAKTQTLKLEEYYSALIQKQNQS